VIEDCDHNQLIKHLHQKLIDIDWSWYGNFGRTSKHLNSSK
jgi:hypothetical protein